MTPRRLVCLLLLPLALAGCAPFSHPHAPSPPPAGAPCVPVGGWLVPATGARLTTAQVIDRAARRRVVLLGESHDRVEDHRWQLQTLAALQARRPALVVGFEMFARSAAPALDLWVEGRLDETDFLARSGWYEFWEFPAELYLPLFYFTRMNRVPMLALSVERTLVARIAAHGWPSIPAAEREGLSDPAPADPVYRGKLAAAYDAHAEVASGNSASDAGLQRFVEAQLVWDRAFAEAIATALQENPNALVVGIIGSGHLEHRHGTPHQLAALGIDDMEVLLPWDEERDCRELDARLADAVFGIEKASEAETRPRLGVLIEPHADGVRVLEIEGGSVAAACGLGAGDVIVEAAGVRVETPAELRRIVGNQAPGTWLPLRVRRGDESREVVARFPARR